MLGIVAQFFTYIEHMLQQFFPLSPWLEFPFEALAYNGH